MVLSQLLQRQEKSSGEKEHEEFQSTGDVKAWLLIWGCCHWRLVTMKRPTSRPGFPIAIEAHHGCLFRWQPSRTYFLTLAIWVQCLLLLSLWVFFFLFLCGNSEKSLKTAPGVHGTNLLSYSVKGSILNNEKWKRRPTSWHGQEPLATFTIVQYHELEWNVMPVPILLPQGDY